MRAHHIRSYGPVVNTDSGPTNPTTGDSPADHAGVPRYEIRVGGHLEPRWAARFDGLDLATDDDGTTVIRGPVADQAALHGLLQRLRDIGIPLVSLTRIASAAPADPPDLRTHPCPPNPSGATS